MPEGSSGMAVIPVALALGATLMVLRPLGTTWAVEAVKAEDAGKALSLLSVVTWTVVILVPPAFGYLVVNLSWRAAWLLIAFMVGSTVPILLIRPVERRVTAFHRQ